VVVVNWGELDSFVVGKMIFTVDDVRGWDDDVIKTNAVVMLVVLATELLFISSIFTVLLL
jgi:hypothetical protein